MKKQYCFIVPLLILNLTCLFAGDVTNFTGTWMLDESKIEAGGERPRMAALKLTVSQDEKQLTVERFISSEFRGDYTSTEKVTLDGKETLNTSDSGNRKLTAVWSEDGKMLTIKSVMDMNRQGETFQINSTEIWTLTEDPAVLKIDQTRVSPRGERQSVLYYNREKNPDIENTGN